MKKQHKYEILINTHHLAVAIYKLKGCNFPKNMWMWNATHPEEKFCWYAACKAQELLKDVSLDEINDLLEYSDENGFMDHQHYRKL